MLSKVDLTALALKSKKCRSRIPNVQVHFNDDGPGHGFFDNARKVLLVHYRVGCEDAGDHW